MHHVLLTIANGTSSNCFLSGKIDMAYDILQLYISISKQVLCYCKYTELEYDHIVKSRRNLITEIQNQIRNKKERKGKEIEELTINQDF